MSSYLPVVFEVVLVLFESELMCDMLDGNSFSEWTPTPCKQTIAQETGAAFPNVIWFLFYFQAQGHTASPRSFTELHIFLHNLEEGMDS